MNLFLFAFGSLFSVINPLGTIPIFSGLTEGKERKEVIRIALLASLNTFVILIISFFGGRYLLAFFGIGLPALKITGGMIIISSGFALLTGSFSKHKGMRKGFRADLSSRSSVSLTPLAIPMLAGPGSMSLLIAYDSEYIAGQEKLLVSAAVFSVAVITFLLLSFSAYIARILGSSGMNAISRVVGFLVIAIGVEFILATLLSIFKSIA